MQQEIFCIVAGQRSGTTALRSLLSGTGRFADLGEIFDTSTMAQPELFFGYCRRQKIGIADILSGPDAERLCKDYVGMLRGLSVGKHLLIDVKFNSWGEMRMPWTFLHQEPFFLSQLKWRGAKFVFVWRKDIVAQVLSDRVSEKLGKWHNITPADAVAPFALDVDRIRRRAELLCQSERYFFRNMRNTKNVAVLCYETLFDEKGFLAPAARTKLASLAGEPLVFAEEPLYRRNDIDKRALVTNYDEIAAAIRDAAAEYRDRALLTGDIHTS